MLPTVHVNDPGSATAGTIFGGAFLGPDTFQETNLAFYDIDRDCTLQDAIAGTAAGAAAAQGHAYLLSIGDVNSVVHVFLAAEIQPTSVQRSVPAIRFKKGDRIFIRGVALTAVLEATVLMLRFAPSAQVSSTR
jgi:hypothetical protein